MHPPPPPPTHTRELNVYPDTYLGEQRCCNQRVIISAHHIFIEIKYEYKNTIQYCNTGKNNKLNFQGEDMFFLKKTHPYWHSTITMRYNIICQWNILWCSNPLIFNYLISICLRFIYICRYPCVLMPSTLFVLINNFSFTKNRYNI